MLAITNVANLMRVRAFAPSAVALLFVVLSQAVGGTFMALFAVQRAGLSPLELSVFLTASAVMGIAASTILGKRFDRRVSAADIFATLLLGIVGYLLLAATTDFLLLVLIAAIPVGIGSAAFGLIFALAKKQLDAVDEATAERGLAAIRMISSLAWAIGPALGAALVYFWRYEGVFLGSAACAAIATATVALSGIWRLPPTPSSIAPEATATAPIGGRVALAVGSIGIFHMAMFMGSIALSITVVDALGGHESDVGLLFSLCAALEVLVMACFVIWPTMGSRRRWLIAGFGVFALYYVTLSVFPTLEAAYWSQITRAVAIGILSVVGMSYLQALLPSRAGFAAGLYGSAVNAGAVLSGLLTGPWAAAFGYASIFLLCAMLSVLGGLALIVPGRRGERRG